MKTLNKFLTAERQKTCSKKMIGLDIPTYSAKTDSKHAKHTSSILNKICILLYISYIFPASQKN